MEVTQYLRYRGAVYKSAEGRPFCTGLCAEFAVALHRLSGWPLYGAFERHYDPDYQESSYTLIHAFVVPRPGYVVDAVGLRRKQQMMQDLYTAPGAKVVVRATSEADLDAESMEGLLPYVLAEAEAVIRQSPETYGLRDRLG